MKEQKEVTGSLDFAKGMGDTHKSERFNQVQASFNQILHQFTLLSKTWKVK